MAGLKAGARYFHVTVNAIGERAGMADLAQVVVALKKLYDRDLGIDLTKLKVMSRLVAEAANHEVLPWQPVTGDNVFAHESGIHANGMFRDTSSFEPFPPEDVGGERRYVLGKHSGRALVAWALEQQGVEPREDSSPTCSTRCASSPSACAERFPRKRPWSSTRRPLRRRPSDGPPASGGGPARHAVFGISPVRRRAVRPSRRRARSCPRPPPR
ncbi:hypothetical protein NKH18_42905 [Streptomyces sp. M10(2022)]